MRSVTLQGHNFTVTDDPRGILADFLALAICDPGASNAQIETLLTPPSEGYSVRDETGAYLIEDSDDIPDSFRRSGMTALPDGEWWVVWRDRRGQGSLNMLVAGDDFRQLFGVPLSYGDSQAK